jgi:uncharacterized protein (TIGR03083 family)
VGQAKRPPRTEIARAVAAERERLVADVAKIAPSDWTVQSLCTEWTVKDVAAHLVRIDDYYRHPYTFGWDLLRHRFRLNTALAESAKKLAGSHSDAEMLDRLRNAKYEKTLTFRLHPQPMFALSEWIVHGQDIRRPLGIPATFAPEHLMPIAKVATRWYAWDKRKHTPDVRLEATDADFAIGEGPTYRGPLEAITMYVLGRRSVLSELERGSDPTAGQAERSG